MSKDSVHELREVAQELPGLFNVLSENLPKLINSLLGTLYSEESARNLGKATAAFYKELVEAGIPQEEALKMAKDYVGSLNKVMQNAPNLGGSRHGYKVKIDTKDQD